MTDRQVTNDSSGRVDPAPPKGRIALIEAGSPGLNIYSHIAMGRGAALLATVVRDSGYEVRAFIEDISGKDSIDWDFVRAADVVGFSTITCTLPRTGRLMERVRAARPEAVIILGGPEPTCSPERSLDLGADFVLKGEAEETFPRFLDAVRGHSTEPLERIPGIVWREEGGLREGPPATQLLRPDLDSLPPVDRSLVHEAGSADCAPVWRARGCPQRCDFCEVCEIWPRYVVRSDENSLSELIEAQDAGYSTVFLVDDNAAANKPAFKEFLRAATKRGFVTSIAAQIRADSAFLPDGRLDREFLRLLRRLSSVTIVCVGVESASDAALQQIHKWSDAARTARALKAMRRYGLLVHGMFIAFREDGKDVIRRNGEYARKYVSSLQYLFETPLPGTKRTLEHEENDAVMFTDPDDLALYDGMHVVLRPEKMDAAEMQDLVVKEYQRFYSTRRVVAAALHGTFVRFRRLSEAQRAHLRQLEPGRRLRRWLRFHIEYKYAPVAFLAIGRQRVKKVMSDPVYADFVARLRSMKGEPLQHVPPRV